VPLIANISRSLLEQNNPWTESKLSKGERGDDCRETLRKLLGFTRRKSNRPKCCVTGLRPVKCAHLIPCSATALQLANVGLTVAEVNSTANLVFWMPSIEFYYDRLQLSFMKTNPLQDKLFLKIWDDSIRDSKLHDDPRVLTTPTIGDIDGYEIKLQHKVYTRLLAYQAYQACLKYGSDERTTRQSLYGSPGNYAFRSQADLLLSQFQKDTEEEIDEYEPRAAGGGGGSSITRKIKTDKKENTI